MASGGGIPRAYAAAAGRAVCGARIQSAGAPAKHPPGLRTSLPHHGFRLLQRNTMVVLRSSLELHNRSTTSSATDSLDLSSEFLSLEDSGRRRSGMTRAAEKSRVPTAAAAAAGVSTSLGRGPSGPGWRRRAEGSCGVRGPARRAGVGSGRGAAKWKVPERRS